MGCQGQLEHWIETEEKDSLVETFKKDSLAVSIVMDLVNLFLTSW